MNYIDFHCDTLMKAWMGRKKTLSAPGGMVSLAGLKEGGCKAQFFAIFMPPVNLKKIAGLFFTEGRSVYRKEPADFPQYGYALSRCVCGG